MVETNVLHRVWRARFYVLLSASFTLAGCASIPSSVGPEEHFLKAHYILAHEDGFALSTEKELLRHKKLSAKEARDDIRKRIIAGIDTYALGRWLDHGEKKEGEQAMGEPLQLMVYAHGGLNGYGNDFDRMRTLLAAPADCKPGHAPLRLFASAECANARTRYYPIFVNWNSEVWDSIRDDLFFIRFGKRVDETTWPMVITAPFVAAGRLAEGIFSAMNGFAVNVKTFGQSEPGAFDWFEGGTTLLPRALTTPVVKAFGTSAWEIMNRRAGVLTARRLDSKREGVVWSLLNELDGRIEVINDRAYWKIASRPGAKVPVEITLVGHSMGAIVLNRALVASRGLPTARAIKRVVYLAAAASIKDTEAVRLIDQANQGPRFWSFTLSRRDEARERSFFGLAPRGTLLVWVDDFFEPVVEPAGKRSGAARSQEEFAGSWPEGPANCEWDGKVEARPRSHSALNKPEFLEAALRHVDSSLFAASDDEPKTIVHCTQ